MAEKTMESEQKTSDAITLPGDTQADQRSRDKGKGILLEEDVTDVMNLKPQDLAKPLELKVYRKWASRNVPDPNPTGLCFMLLDKQVLHSYLGIQINTRNNTVLQMFPYIYTDAFIPREGQSRRMFSCGMYASLMQN